MRRFFPQHVSLKLAFVNGLIGVILMGLFIGFISQLDFSQIGRKHIILFISFFAVLFLGLQSLIIVFLVQWYVNRPIHILMKAMNRVKEGRWVEHPDNHRHDEWGELSGVFNEMIHSIKHMSENRKSVEEKLIKAEEGLKYRIALEEKTRLIEKMNNELASAFQNIALLYTVAQHISKTLEIKDLVVKVSQIFSERFPCDGFALYFSDKKNTKLKVAAHNKLPIPQGDIVPFGSGIVGRTAQKNHSFHISDFRKFVEYQLGDKANARDGSMFSLPLNVRHRLVGVLIVFRKECEAFPHPVRQSLEAMGGQIAIAYERAMLYTQTKNLSIRDELTGAFNRRHFQQMSQMEFKRALRFNRPLSLLMIDVDRFKQFNDTHGHIKGDELLKRLTILIYTNIRELDILSRFGGEEFVVLLTDTGLNDAVRVAHKIRNILAKHLYLEDDRDPKGPRLSTTVSIGVASVPGAGDSVKALIERADEALYAAKRAGRDTVRYFNPEVGVANSPLIRVS